MVTLWYCQENLCIKSYISRKRFMKNLSILKIESKKKNNISGLKFDFLFTLIPTYIYNRVKSVHLPGFPRIRTRNTPNTETFHAVHIT